MKTTRHYLYEQAIAGFIINFIINAAIAWGVYRSHDTVPLWGDQSIMGDTIATAFILTFLTSLIVTKLTRDQVAAGKLQADKGSRPLLRHLPYGNFVRSIVVGLVAIPLPTLVVWAVFTLLNQHELAPYPFIAIKALIAGLISVYVAPPIALAALDVRPAAPTDANAT